MRHMLLIIALALPSTTGAAPGRGAATQSTASASSDSSAYTVGDLSPSTGVPWNPPEVMPARRGWEQTLLMPGRIVTYPISAIGAIVSNAMLGVESAGRIPTTFSPAKPGRPGSGFSIRQPALGGRAGAGAAFELRRTAFSGPAEVLLRARYAGTFRHYNGTQLSIVGDPLTLRYGYDWRPEEHYYGTGPSSIEGSRTNYALQGDYLGLTLASDREKWRPHLRRTRVSAWAETHAERISHGRQNDVPSYETEFPTLADATLGQRVEHFIYGAGFTLDGRRGVSRWDRGARLAVMAERHDAPIPWLALHVGSPTGAQFTRYQYESEAGFSFHRIDPRTLRVLVRVVDQTPGNNPDLRLPSEMATLGGSVGLAGFDPGRFHDTDAVLMRAAYIFPVVRRLEMDLHSEWGAVYPDFWSDAQFRTLSNSIGMTLRLRYEVGPVAALGFDVSREGVRMKYALGGIE